MIKWNEEYEVFVSDEGKVFNKKMKEYTLWPNKVGYLRFETRRNGKRLRKSVHRVVYETFNEKIPEGLQIDHINRDKTDNRPNNLRCVTGFENRHNRDDIVTDFGIKYLEHFGYSYKENPVQYNREYYWFRNHGKCRWE